MPYSSYQPNMDQQTVRKIATDAGRSILEKTIIYGFEITKFIFKFIQDALKQVIGR